VVVPVYNVEQFLRACLDSLLSQSFSDLEAVVVVDGATDSSERIARDYAACDRRVRVVTQDNAGLGAARNTGAREARGEYLTFLDSDDTLPPDAYAHMMETITRSGSDLVAGTLTRDDGGRRSAMRLMEANHRERRERAVLTDMPLMLADVFAVNKIYRRSFWDAVGLAFPVGLRYEDQPVLTRALIAARHFDVIPEVVYLWRVRHDRNSITQRRHELGDLTDRVESKRLSTALVHQAGLPGLLDTWYRDILPVDMWEYFRCVPGCSDAYWDSLQLAVRRFWNDDSVRFEVTRVPAQQRLMGWLVERGRRAELEQLIDYVDRHRGNIPVELRGGTMVASLPGVDDPEAGLPEAVYVLGQHELR
jgi:glycosyltransferase involved in cell wall biosynthesis